MQNQEPIRSAIERTVRAITAKPSFGQGTKTTHVRLGPGLSCEVQDGPWKFAVGIADSYGGSDDAPNPGVYGRAALGSCLAIGYGMWAARLGIPLNALEVEVQADYDARGELGIDPSLRPGYLRMRYIVTVDADAPEDEVLRFLDTAERYSSWVDDLANPVPLTREVRLTRTKSQDTPG